LKAFGTAGVRGVFNLGQTPEQVYDLVLSSAFTFGRGRYGVGWDGRKSSAILSRVAGAAISAAGSEGVLFGLVPTPVTAYGTRQEGCKLGFSVTASHNPPEYSGLKVFDGHGMELSKQDEAKIERVMVVKPRMDSRSIGDVTGRRVLDSYLRSMLSRFETIAQGLRILVDCSNGPAAFVTPEMLDALGHRVIPLNAQVSWRFSARPPEPTSQNISETASMVRELGADLGFAHDGDADRLVMINSAGRILPDSLTSIMVMKALVKKRGTVVLSENTSSAVEEEALGLGAKVVRSRIGKTFAEIGKENAVFATEPSKVVDPSWGMWEDGMYGVVLIADAIARDRSLLSLLDSEPRWHYKQVNVPRQVNFDDLARRAENVFARFRVSNVRRLDGIKLVFKDRSWIMFRASGTEPKTRIYCESLDVLRVEELVAVGRAVIEDTSVTGTRAR
jgi:phosphomannomutase